MRKTDWDKALSCIPEIESRAALEQPFSHLQWYLNQARNTVYLAAESDEALSEDDLHNVARLFMKLAPQLNCRADNRGERLRPAAGHV